MEEGRGVYRVLVGKPEGKWPWEDQGVGGRILLNGSYKEVVCGVMDWIELA
jgi:hypothetical protein